MTKKYEAVDIAKLKAEVEQLETDLAVANNNIAQLIAQLIAQMETKADKAGSASLARKVIDSAGTTENMDFGKAIVFLKQGCRVSRKGWNGKDMFLYLVHASDVTSNDLRGAAREHNLKNIGLTHFNAHIDMKCADGSICVGWLASQTDMLASDWYIV